MIHCSSKVKYRRNLRWRRCSPGTTSYAYVAPVGDSAQTSQFSNAHALLSSIARYFDFSLYNYLSPVTSTVYMTREGSDVTAKMSKSPWSRTLVTCTVIYVTNEFARNLMLSIQLGQFILANVSNCITEGFT